MSYTPTQITFTQAIFSLSSPVQKIQPQGDQLCIVTARTPFHPVSHIWPDHPADRGTLSTAQASYAVTDCQVGAIELASGELYVGQAIPVKRDEPGWVFVVVHLIEAPDSVVSVGEDVVLSVDEEYQHSLSRGHSAGHLAYLALNKVLAAGYWRKDAERKDPHGHCDFNSYAQVTSFVDQDSCLDTYRLGKTLRKRGLNSENMLLDLAEIESKVNQQLATWLATEAAISMRCEGKNLTDSRYWQCDLQEGNPAVIPCGGTHATSLTEFTSLQVSLTQRDEQHIEMHTRVNLTSEQ